MTRSDYHNCEWRWRVFPSKKFSTICIQIKITMPEFENHLTSSADDRPQPPNGENRSHVEIQVLEPPLPPRSRSIRRSRRQSSRRSNSSAETITMQESSTYGGVGSGGGRPRQPVTLKASFLRRKIAEYEGNKVDIRVRVFLCISSSVRYRVYLSFTTLGALELVIYNITPHYCISPPSCVCLLNIYHIIHTYIARSCWLLVELVSGCTYCVEIK